MQFDTRSPPPIIVDRLTWSTKHFSRCASGQDEPNPAIWLVSGCVVHNSGKFEQNSTLFLIVLEVRSFCSLHYSCVYGGPQLSQQNKKSRHYKLNSRQNRINSRQNTINSRQNEINSRQNKENELVSGCSAVVTCFTNGMSCNSNALLARKPSCLVQCSLSRTHDVL